MITLEFQPQDDGHVSYISFIDEDFEKHPFGGDVSLYIRIASSDTPLENLEFFRAEECVLSGEYSEFNRGASFSFEAQFIQRLVESVPIILSGLLVNIAATALWELIKGWLPNPPSHIPDFKVLSNLLVERGLDPANFEIQSLTSNTDGYIKAVLHRISPVSGLDECLFVELFAGRLTINRVQQLSKLNSKFHEKDM